MGIQVQQGADATRSATALQIKEAWVQFNLTAATNVELNEAFSAAETNGFEITTSAQRAMIDAMNRAWFHNLANAYYQYRIGTLEEEQWEPHLNEIETISNSPLDRGSWERWRNLYDKSFQNLVDASIDSPE